MLSIPHDLIETAPRLMPVLLKHNLTFGMFAALCAVANKPRGTMRDYDASMRRHVKTIHETGLVHMTRDQPNGKGRPSFRYAINQDGQAKLHHILQSVKSV
jgi:hypothetical protein